MANSTELEFERYQDPNGLFPAAINCDPVMENFWIRDNYYIYLAVNQEAKEKIIRGFQKIVDNNIEKIKYHGKVKPTKDYEYIHPRYNENLKEIPEPWGWVQNDSVGNLLEILSNARDKKRTELIVDYLNTIEYWRCKDYGFWEEWPKEIRSSSLAACIRGLDSYKRNIENNRKIEELINKGYKSLYEILPNETKTRKHDLALLSLIYPGKLRAEIVTDSIKEQIITNVQCLEGHWGIKRYFGDKWDGIDWTLGRGKERQWNFLSWLYLCTGESPYIERAKEIIEKFGAVEGIVEGEPRGTSFLLWVIAMYRLAEVKFECSTPSK